MSDLGYVGINLNIFDEKNIKIVSSQETIKDVTPMKWEISNKEKKMEELRNKCVELSEIVFAEIDKLPEELQDQIYEENKHSQLSEKDGTVYFLGLLYESLIKSVTYFNNLNKE